MWPQIKLGGERETHMRDSGDHDKDLSLQEEKWGALEAFQGGCWRHHGIDDLRGFLWLPRGVSLETWVGGINQGGSCFAEA